METVAELIETCDFDGIDGEIEDLQVTLGNLLIAARFVSTDEYSHDPALPQGWVPSLESAVVLSNAVGAERLAVEIY